VTTVPSRWGPADEAGAYNLIDAAAVLRGAAQVREGRVLPLGVPLSGGSRGPAVPSRQPVQHFMTRDGCDYCGSLSEEKAGFGFSDDVIMLPTHGTTHIDALAHVWRDGTMYNGFSATDVSSRGAMRCGIDKLGPISTRALFVDFLREDGRSDHGISRDELVEAVARTGLVPEPGDALLVRTGWMTAYKRGTADPVHSGGLRGECADWIIEQGFCLIAADNVAVEVIPSGDPDCAVPLHIRLIRDSGIYLAELLDLDALAESGRSSCLLTIAPLRIEGGTASPINPVAIL
jgi:kynurenine formamidase